LKTACSHRLLLAAALAVLLVGAPRPASADTAAAEAAFREGRRLAREGRFAEACPLFEASHRAAPALGALLNLAICHEEIGRTASAYAGYRAAQEMARVRVDPREAVARGLADRLAPRLTRLRVELAGAMAHGLIVRRGPSDITDALGVAAAVDPGEHVLEASAPGHVTWLLAVTVTREGETTVVQVPELRADPLAASLGDPNRAVDDPDTESEATEDGATPGGAESADVFPPSACGAADFQLDLSPGAKGLRLAVGAGGDAVMAWSEHGRVAAAEYFAARGRWSRASIALPRGSMPESLTVAVGRRGDALAATSAGTLDAARRTEDRTWIGLSTRGPVALLSPRAAVDDAGNMMLVWTAPDDDGNSWTVRSQRFVAAEQRWQASTALSVPMATGQAPRLAMRGNGDAAVVWRERADHSARLVARRFSAIAGLWSPPHEIDRATALSDPTIAFDHRGDLLVSWNEHRDDSRHLLAAVVAMDRRWGAVHVLATAVGHPEPPVLIEGPDGNVTALWRQGSSADVRGAHWVGSAWSEPAVVVPRNRGTGAVEAASDEHGNAVAAWPRCKGGTCRIEIARRAASDGVWRRVEATHLSRAPVAALSLAVGASQASAFVVWRTAAPAAICVARIW
jgi:hypothetical protein